MVTKGYQKGVYERVTRGIRGETRTQDRFVVHCGPFAED